MESVIVDYEAERSKIKEGQQHQKDLIEAKKIAENIRTRKFWMGLSLFGLLGFPQLQDADSFGEQYDVSAMLTFGLKWQYRRFFMQYQYFMAPGETFEGTFAENGYFIMLGGSFGALKYWSVDLFVGLNFVDVHGKYPYLNDSDVQPMVGVQVNGFIPLTESMNLVLIGQVALSGFYYQELTNDERPSAQESAIQVHLNFGVGVRFWTPKPRSMYKKKYLDLILE